MAASPPARQVHTDKWTVLLGLKTPLKLARYAQKSRSEEMKHLLLILSPILQLGEIDPELPNIVDELGERILERRASRYYVELDATDDVITVGLNPPDALGQDDLLILDRQRRRTHRRLSLGRMLANYVCLSIGHGATTSHGAIIRRYRFLSSRSVWQSYSNRIASTRLRVPYRLCYTRS